MTVHYSVIGLHSDIQAEVFNWWMGALMGAGGFLRTAEPNTHRRRNNIHVGGGAGSSNNIIQLGIEKEHNILSV